MVTQVSSRPRPPAALPEALAVEHFVGLDNRPRLIFAHGFGQTRLAWQRSAQVLAAHGFSGTTFDARGHGDSAWNAAGEMYQMEQFIDDLAGLAQAEPAPPILIGASMGGLLGLFAQGHVRPVPFRALVLVDITPRWDTAGVERILGFMTAHPEGFDDLDHAAHAIAAYLPHRPERKTPAQLEKLLNRGADGRWRWHWDPRLIDSIGRRGEDQQAQLIDAARRVDVPTLLISGGRSDLVSQAHVDEFLELVPHAHHVCLPKATHMVAGDDNDAFTRTILDFLVTLPAGSAHRAGDPS
ncbi:MAG TPA: alpha/beta hydrolase [Chiayiivirga sp.]|nr:alpha/beta hydrolase [Chiayiivirga sp.]